MKGQYSHLWTIIVYHTRMYVLQGRQHSQTQLKIKGVTLRSQKVETIKSNPVCVGYKKNKMWLVRSEVYRSRNNNNSFIMA